MNTSILTMCSFLNALKLLCILTLVFPAFVQAQSRLTSETAGNAQPSSADEVIQMSVFDVTSDRDVGYLSTNSESATRLNVPISDIPQSILVFNQEFLDDLLAESFDDFVMYDPSVQTVSEDDSFNMRGIGSGSTDQVGSYYNGFPMEAGYGKQMLVTTERAEILKGPNAVLYGAGAFGGTMNLVSKKAMFKTATRMNMTYDSNGYFLSKIDFNTPVIKRRLAFRLNALWANGEDARSNTKSAWAIAPTFTWQIAHRTVLIAEYTHQVQESVANVGFPVLGGNPFAMQMANGSWRAVDPRRRLNDADDLRENTRDVIYADFRHEFSNHLMFRSMFGYEFKNAYQNEVYPSSGFTNLDRTSDPTTVWLSPIYRFYDYDYKNVRTRNELVAKINTWGLKHQIIGGWSWDRQERRSYRRESTAGEYPKIDLFNHEPRPVPEEYKNRSKLKNANPNSLQTMYLPAYYINDLISMFEERFFIQTGFKYIDNRRNTINMRYNPVRTDFVEEESTTHSLGLVYHFTRDKAWTLYLNNNTTYSPNFTLARDGSMLKSREGDQYEGGIKYVYKDKFSAMFSAYSIQIKNEPELVDGDDTDYYITTDGIRSRGVEFIAHWNVTPVWQIYGGYAYTHCIDKRTGDRRYNVPLHGVSLFTRYQLKQGPLKGLSFRFGYQWRDSSMSGVNASSPEPEWRIPTFINITAGASYEIRMKKKRFQISLQVKNLTDQYNISNARNIYVRVADPRTWILGLGSRF
ncbi:TonB-dependent receptor plug domain-containing protein [Termitidicoccus mucosus]|uniref:TonB-dependent receptor plug domain-containing protein n=1 Tax=Termitidicoccus mucosus TaxID=1184151 RepID=A0A178IPH9_9BACT|nr:hypothetical protein AW736_04040 [Opitutaceae bacterium TSB47]